MSRPAGPDDLGSLGIGSLRARYRSGELVPVEVVETVLDRIAARGQDGTWISLVDRDQVLASALALDPERLDELPLYGIPFGLKDNIDAAGEVTTVACPAYAYRAERSAVLVDRLVAAGAILVGKTNLDQFATGLNGTRSPYGVPTSVFGDQMIAGGSSSGSAVAVAAGLVSFSIGTDTAGSGRVPAALNNVVGVKPSIGLVPTTGVVPACRSLDCPSVFALTVADGSAVLAAIAGTDAEDPMSRPLPVPPAVPAPRPLGGVRYAVPARIADWGGRGEQQAWQEVLDTVTAAGAEVVEIDLELFLEAGRQLYGGAWLAERHAVLGAILSSSPDEVLPVLRTLMAGADEITGAQAFEAVVAMGSSRRRARAALAGVDALLTPTVTTTFTVAELEADPVVNNSRLGTFTTFTNLLDLCALAVPAGLTTAGAPFGITLHAPRARDAALASLGCALESALGQAPGAPWIAPAEAAAPTEVAAPAPGGFLLAVVGAHLAGMPLHPDLVARGAELVVATTTAPTYRLHALEGTTPPKPGLERVAADGAAIEVEVYRLPLAEVGGFLATVHAPLGIGEVLLADGTAVHGFICEPAGLAGAADITRHGGWRAYRAASARSEPAPA
ncbi:MAG: allophanate hydrolase [Marmoricola sp.]